MTTMEMYTRVRDARPCGDREQPLGSLHVSLAPSEGARGAVDDGVHPTACSPSPVIRSPLYRGSPLRRGSCSRRRPPKRSTCGGRAARRSREPRSPRTLDQQPAWLPFYGLTTGCGPDFAHAAIGDAVGASSK